MKTDEQDSLIERFQCGDGSLTIFQTRMAVALMDERKRNAETRPNVSGNIDDVRNALLERVNAAISQPVLKQSLPSEQTVTLSGHCLQKLDVLAKQYGCSRESIVEHLVDAVSQKAGWTMKTVKPESPED